MRGVFELTQIYLHVSDGCDKVIKVDFYRRNVMYGMFCYFIIRCSCFDIRMYGNYSFGGRIWLI